MSRRFESILLGSTLTLALVGASLAVPAAAFADAVDVATEAQFAAAFENPNGSDIRLTADVDGSTQAYEEADGFTVSIDLNGHDLAVNSLRGGNGSYLFITDSTAEGGTLTATATFGLYPGIYTAQSELHIDGTAHVDATGTVNQPGIGGATDGTHHDGGAIFIGGDAVVTATGGSTVTHASGAAAGIGGSALGNGPYLSVSGNAAVYAMAGFSDVGQPAGAGIGGGVNGDGGTVIVGDSATVTAIGRNGGAGIGSGRRTGVGAVGGGTVTISGSANVTARTEGLDPGGFGGAGIGGGSNDIGATVTVADSATVDATGGYLAAAIGGGYKGNGKSFVSSGTSTITAKSSVNAIGNGSAPTTPNVGIVTIGAGTTLAIPSGYAETIPNGQQVTNNGIIRSTGLLAGPGKVVNNGSIVVGTTTPTAPITNHNYSVQFDPQGGDLPAGSSPLAVRASSATAAELAFPTPTRAGYLFTGWNSEADGSGPTIGADTDISGAPPSGLGASTGAAIVGQLYAQWQFIKLASNVSVSVSPNPLPFGTAPQATAVVTAGTTGPVSFALDGASASLIAQSPDATVTLPSDLSVGTHTLVASYSGDDTYLGASGSTSFVITALPSATSFTLSAPVVVSGTAVTATPTLTAGATGAVSISSDGTLLGSTTSGVPFALPSLTVGTHTITASYSGDASHSGSAASATLTVTAPVATGTPIPSTTVAHPKLTVTAKKFAKNHKPKVTLRFSKLAAGQKVTGKVAVYVGGKKVKTVTISKKTVTSVTLPKKYAKAISVKAVFAGSSTIAKTTSKVVKVRLK